MRADSFSDEWADDDGEQTPAIPVEKLSATEQLALLVDSLDVGLVLVTQAGRILKRNHIATRMLAAFGTQTDVIPASLWRPLDALIAAALAVPSRFTPSSPFTSPARGRYFVRARALTSGGIVLSLAPAALRENDVSRVLAEKFGLNAQEIRIAFFAAQGYRNREIADRLEIVEGTVKNYLTNVFAALSVRSRTELSTELAQLVEEQSDVTGSGSP
ncbi:hypothetical protein BH11MYX3_BH11MYX3_33680 [soil metagenome]